MFNASRRHVRGAMLVAVVCGLTAAALAWHHPLWPALCLVGLALWGVAEFARPGIWLLVVPAAVGVLNFAPWTGWLVFEEFDLLLLGALAGGYGRWAWSAPRRVPVNGISCTLVLLLALACNTLVSLLHGVADAGGLALDWFAGYTDALNSVRVAKSPLLALLFAPLMHLECRRNSALSQQRLAWGMVIGLSFVTLAVLWERAAFPGVLDFSRNYRTVALFWEMHVGGGAIDAYLAMATPFAAWAVLGAKRPAVWGAAAVLALLTGYAVLTTFARGVYLAVTGGLLMLAALQAPRRRLQGWRIPASALLALALVAEVLTVWLGGSFMAERLASAHSDFSSRVAHWRDGAGLLQSPRNWLCGIGLGRFPAHYAQLGASHEFSGAVTAHQETLEDGSTHGFVRIRGPLTHKELGGQFALTQRVRQPSAGGYTAHVRVRVTHPTQVQIELCERHLLYDGRCQRSTFGVSAEPQGWQWVQAPLRGDAFAADWFAPARLHLFSISVTSPGGIADFDAVELAGPTTTPLLANRHLNHGLAQWFPAAQDYYVPWHADSLFLELLIERGLSGLLLHCALWGYALWFAVAGPGKKNQCSPYLTASLCAVLGVGLLSSVMDVPRVAFLQYLLACMATQKIRLAHSHEKNQKPHGPSAQTPGSSGNCGA